MRTWGAACCAPTLASDHWLGVGVGFGLGVVEFDFGVVEVGFGLAAGVGVAVGTGLMIVALLMTSSLGKFLSRYDLPVFSICS